MAKLKFDISCPNFDSYFSKSIENIGEQEKSSLPKELLFKLFRRGGIYDATSTNKLTFIAKLFILFKCLKKRWYIVVEDEENGMSVEQFWAFRKALGKRNYDLNNAGELISTGIFVLASKELAETYGHLNNLSVSNAYNFLVKTKNTEVSKFTEYRQRMDYITNLFSFYESQKKTWVMATGLSIPEFLVLTYIYSRGEVVSAQLHKTIYKYAYNSSSTQIKLAFGTLQRKGMVEKIGVNKAVKLKITAAGIEIIDHIFRKYALNC